MGRQQAEYHGQGCARDHGGHRTGMRPEQRAGPGADDGGAGIEVLDEDIRRIAGKDVPQDSAAHACEDADEGATLTTSSKRNTSILAVWSPNRY